MNENEIPLFNDSLERCTAGQDFLDRFYETFLAPSTEVAEKFKNTFMTIALLRFLRQ